MRKYILIATLAACLGGCGVGEKIYDRANYESLTNERGNVEVLSGGKVVRTYNNVTILYSASDTQAMWIVVDGKQIYLQGDCIIEII